MGQQTRNSSESNKFRRTAWNNMCGTDDENVTAEDRRDQVLSFLVDVDIPLPPTAVYAGIRRKYNATFAYRTTQEILKDLVDDGYAIRVDTKMLREKGEIQRIENDPDRRKRAYYFPTDAGQERIS